MLLFDSEKHNIKVGAIGIDVTCLLDAKTGVVRHQLKFKGGKMFFSERLRAKSINYLFG